MNPIEMEPRIAHEGTLSLGTTTALSVQAFLEECEKQKKTNKNLLESILKEIALVTNVDPRGLNSNLRQQGCVNFSDAIEKLFGNLKLILTMARSCGHFLKKNRSNYADQRYRNWAWETVPLSMKITAFPQQLSMEYPFNVFIEITDGLQWFMEEQHYFKNEMVKTLECLVRSIEWIASGQQIPPWQPIVTLDNVIDRFCSITDSLASIAVVYNKHFITICSMTSVTIKPLASITAAAATSAAAANVAAAYAVQAAQAAQKAATAASNAAATAAANASANAPVNAIAAAAANVAANASASITAAKTAAAKASATADAACASSAVTNTTVNAAIESADINCDVNSAAIIANSIAAVNLNSNTAPYVAGNVNNADATYAHAANADATYSNVANANATYSNVANADSTYANVANANATYANVANVNATYANVANDANVANVANINYANITNGTYNTNANYPNNGPHNMYTTYGTYATHTAYSNFARNAGTSTDNVNVVNVAYTNNAAKDPNASVHAVFNVTNTTVNTATNAAMTAAENAAAHSAANVANLDAAIPAVPLQRPPWMTNPLQSSLTLKELQLWRRWNMKKTVENWYDQFLENPKFNKSWVKLVINPNQ